MVKYFVFFLSSFFVETVVFGQSKNPSLEQLIGPRAISSHFGLLTGVWVPTRDLEVLGIHPSIGIQGGLRYKRSDFDITVDFRFLKAADSYDVYRPPYVYTLDNYFGGYIGLDYKYYFLADRNREVGILAGIGYDGFDISKGEEDYLDPASINSLNLNIGFRLNWYVKGQTYFSLQPRYNIIHYNNDGGTSLAGNAFSIEFFVGGWTEH